MAAPDLQLCTRQDVIDVFSGDLVTLRELAGGSGTTFDQSTLDKPILVGSSDVASSGDNKFNIAYNADPTMYSMRIRHLASVRAAYWFWLFNAKGKAMPPHLQSAVEKVDHDLERVEDGKKGLGQHKAPGSRVTSAGPMDIRLPPGGGFSNRMTVAGFRRW